MKLIFRYSNFIMKKGVFLFIFILGFFLVFPQSVKSQHHAACNQSCTGAPNQGSCVSGLVCLSGSNICRNPNCPNINDCSCPTYKIQGYKVMMPGNQAVEPASSQTVTISGIGNYTTNPYIATGITQNRTVSVTAPSGSLAGYTLCYNSTNCHTNNPTTGSSVNIISSNVITGSNDTNDFYYADLWWHFTPQTPNCKNLTALDTVLTGDQITLSAIYEDGELGGQIFPVTKAGMVVYDNPGGCDFSPFDASQTGGAGTYQFNWTPSNAGGYTAFCRAWNDDVAECRGTCVDGPPRYSCSGPNTTKTIIVQNPGPWYKLKDASLNKIGSHNISVVQNILPFDTDDNNTRRVIINSNNSNPGVIITTGTYNPGPTYNPIPGNSNNVSTDKYTQNYVNFNTLLTFYEYAISRKAIKKITDINSEVTGSGLYYINSDNLTLSSIPNQNFILIIRNSSNSNYGDLTINTDNFNSIGKSVAFIANNITFGSTVQSVQGIFVATNQFTYNNTSSGLKIKGNLISKNQVTIRQRTNNTIPSLFIVFSPQMYLDLLPYLSIDKYDWRQLQ